MWRGREIKCLLRALHNEGKREGKREEKREEKREGRRVRSLMLVFTFVHFSTLFFPA